VNHLTERLIYTKEDGGVAIVTSTGEVPEEVLITKVVPEGVDHEIISINALPADRTFRNAWEKDDNSVTVNMTKAIVIAQDIVRVSRDARLIELDVLVMRADEDDNTELKASIIRDKIALRDITANTRLADATNEVDLKNGVESLLTLVRILGAIHNAPEAARVTPLAVFPPIP